jgi:hypothetical protein
VSFCPKCDAKVANTIGDMMPDGRVVECCPTCMSAVVVEVTPEPAITMPIAATERPRKALAAASRVPDLLGAVHARLEAARSELVTLRLVEQEVAMLERMLAAAQETT